MRIERLLGRRFVNGESGVTWVVPIKGRDGVERYGWVEMGVFSSDLGEFIAQLRLISDRWYWGHIPRARDDLWVAAEENNDDGTQQRCSDNGRSGADLQGRAADGHEVVRFGAVAGVPDPGVEGSADPGDAIDQVYAAEQHAAGWNGAFHEDSRVDRG